MIGRFLKRVWEWLGFGKARLAIKELFDNFTVPQALLVLLVVGLVILSTAMSILAVVGFFFDGFTLADYVWITIFVVTYGFVRISAHLEKKQIEEFNKRFPTSERN